ncbi:RNA 2',3'-cyclic phosphodiesterase [Tsuneonella deserti]|uniref:RNA 2',3'-cyclic phosphodiesterase n=1 Tax=Tsuneonella deserti TaxID=2035528 RepID=A0ABQ1S8M9_9SPHN|nr:RNA 2',3'-cyclic phosphodiesterase [Tsuneonella deserti]GGD96152.1 RNA 2',3'-cyclic phosphodiesterase [Tsuneonella deserti]
MNRLFVALRPPAPVRDALLDLMDGVEGARWQDEDQLHLTLRFVGEVDAPLANDLAAALGGINSPPFETELAGVGYFQRKGRPTALWARPAPCAPLDILQRKVERVCQQIGLEPEHRKFTPHVTLARLGRHAGPINGWLAEHGTFRTGSWQVGEFRLYESTLNAGGSQYDPVASYRLQA